MIGDMFVPPLFTPVLQLAVMALVVFGCHGGVKAGEIDLSRAIVVVPDGLSATESKAVQVLVDECASDRESA
jgi:hypothetical protein